MNIGNSHTVLDETTNISAELFMRYWIELKMSWNAEFLTVQLVVSQIGVLYVLHG